MIELQYRVERAAFKLDVNLELPLQGITGIFGDSCATRLQTGRDVQFVWKAKYTDTIEIKCITCFDVACVNVQLQ